MVIRCITRRRRKQAAKPADHGHHKMHSPRRRKVPRKERKYRKDRTDRKRRKGKHRRNGALSPNRCLSMSPKSLPKMDGQIGRHHARPNPADPNFVPPPPSEPIPEDIMRMHIGMNGINAMNAVNARLQHHNSGDTEEKEGMLAHAPDALPLDTNALPYGGYITNGGFHNVANHDVDEDDLEDAVESREDEQPMLSPPLPPEPPEIPETPEPPLPPVPHQVPPPIPPVPAYAVIGASPGGPAGSPIGGSTGGSNGNPAAPGHTARTRGNSKSSKKTERIIQNRVRPNRSDALPSLPLETNDSRNHHHTNQTPPGHVDVNKKRPVSMAQNQEALMIEPGGDINAHIDPLDPSSDDADDEELTFSSGADHDYDEVDPADIPKRQNSNHKRKRSHLGLVNFKTDTVDNMGRMISEMSSVSSVLKGSQSKGKHHRLLDTDAMSDVTRMISEMSAVSNVLKNRVSLKSRQSKSRSNKEPLMQSSESTENEVEETEEEESSDDNDW